MKVKRWSRPASIAFSVLFIAIMCFTLLPSPVQIGPLSFGGAGVARADTETFTTAGTFYWICPAGVTSVQVEVWGAGAGGAGGFTFSGDRSGNGGGGGAYAKLNSFAVTPGGNYTYVVGAGSPGCAHDVTTGTAGGDSYFNNSTTVKAAGAAAVTGCTSAGGTTAASVGDVKYAGGAGYNAGINGCTLNGQGGGAGGSGGSASAGNNGGYPTGATAVTGGGPGGDGGATTADGHIPASGPGGGGGGGGYSGSRAGGAGYNGQIKLTYDFAPLTIATLAATSITATTATLNGNVTFLSIYGNVTQYGFVLSTSPQSNPGNIIPSAQNLYTTGNWTYPGVQCPAGTTFNSNGNVTGLSKGTCYYFRAAGYTTYGWVYGNELTFVTLPAPITDYFYKKQLFFNTSATGANVTSSNQTNFPVAVHINSSSWSNTTENSNFFCAANIGGKYIQFFDSDQATNLYYEVELYNATGNTSTNEAIYWVRVPSVAGNSTTDSVWIAYGNNPNGGPQNSATGTWDSNYKMVQHMQDPNFIFTNTATYLASGAQAYPVAYHYVGTHDRTYVVWQQQVGTYEWHMWINYYDHDSNTWGTAVDIFHWHSSEINDNHGLPSVIVDNAGYIHVAGACHSTDMMYYRSTSTEDIGDAADHWTDKTATLSIQYGAYPRWTKISDGTLYFFFRDGVDFSGASRNLSYLTTTSTPKGDSWTSVCDIVDFSPGSSDDWVYAGNPAYDSVNGKIHFGWFWHLASDTYDTNLYHAYLKLSDGHMYNMAGTDLGTNISQVEADSSCLLIDSRAISRQVRGQAPVCHLDSSGYPYFLYSITTTGWETGWYYRMMYWTGSAWSSQIEIPVGSYSVFTGDFIIHSTTDIEIYLPGTGGAWDRWKWDGSNISYIKTIIAGGAATGTHYWPQVVENYSNELKAVSGSSGLGIAIDSLDQIVPKIGLASPGLLDSTVSNNGMTKLSSIQPINTTGLIGSGQDFDGSDDYGSTGSTGFPSGAATRTVSFWVNMDNVDSDNQVLLVYGTYTFYQDFQIYTGTAASGRNKIVCSIYAYFDVTNPSTGNLTVGTWAYVSVRVTGDKALTLTVNTISNNVTTANSLNTVLSFAYVSHGDIYSGAYSNCKMDEIRVSAGDRGADWTQLEYYSMAKTNFNGDNGVSAPFISWEAAIENPADISNTPSSWSVGVVQPSQTYWSNGAEPDPWPLEDADCWGNLTNNSSFAVDISASMTDMLGGTTWSIGSSPGTNVFTLKIGIAGKANIGNFTTLSNTPVAWITSMTAGNMTRWTMVFYTPTNTPQFADGTPKSGNMTFEAEPS